MPDATELVRIIKHTAMDAVKADKPVEVCFGNVVSARPLKILVEQKLTLEELASQSYPGPTQGQLKDLLQETKEIHRLLEQAGKKREHHFSLPRLQLPQPTWIWLAVPAILLGLWVLCCSLGVLWSGLTGLLP